MTFQEVCLLEERNADSQLLYLYSSLYFSANSLLVCNLQPNKMKLIWAPSTTITNCTNKINTTELIRFDEGKLEFIF
jgi:hypothetical protein